MDIVKITTLCYSDNETFHCLWCDGSFGDIWRQRKRLSVATKSVCASIDVIINTVQHHWLTHLGRPVVAGRSPAAEGRSGVPEGTRPVAEGTPAAGSPAAGTPAVGTPAVGSPRRLVEGKRRRAEGAVSLGRKDSLARRGVLQNGKKSKPSHPNSDSNRSKTSLTLSWWLFHLPTQSFNTCVSRLLLRTQSNVSAKSGHERRMSVLWRYKASHAQMIAPQPQQDHVYKHNEVMITAYVGNVSGLFEPPNCAYQVQAVWASYRKPPMSVPGCAQANAAALANTCPQCFLLPAVRPLHSLAHLAHFLREGVALQVGEHRVGGQWGSVRDESWWNLTIAGENNTGKQLV